MTKLGHDPVESGEEPGRAEFDDEGVPVHRPVADWLDLVDPGDRLDGRASRWLLAVLRFCRPDGSPVFGPRGRSPSRLKALAEWSRALGDPSLAAVVGRWLPSRSGSPIAISSPPPPSDARPDRPLSVLRPDWSPRGDLVAIDHREPGDRTLLEISARGQTWLGPSWSSPRVEGKVGRAVPSSWTSNAFADCAEWTYRGGRGRTTRVVVLPRGRELAILGQQDDGGGPVQEIRLSLPEGIEAAPVEGSRSILLSAGRGKPTARLIPLGLPAHDRPSDLGSIAIEGREVVVRRVGEGPRRWMPILVCWGKAPTTWRPLTVSHRSKACRPDAASAARVAWGPNEEGLVVYRSLAAPALRSFLGHQTGARFLVGGFTRAGDVRPLLKLDA